MSDKDTRRDLSRELESLKDTLTYEKPAQIPLLDDVVDEENVKPEPQARKQPPAAKGKPSPANDKSPPPDTRDLFDPESLDAADNIAPASKEQLREEVNRVAEEYLQEKADNLAHTWLREQADKMVEELVEEYSTEILKRLKTKLTTQLYAILQDLDTKSDAGDGADNNQNKP
ncbi:MAG: hypothetical protein WD356_05185 [Pseudomonadales bacterium]